MHPLAREVLERLWRSGDGADLRSSSRRPSALLTSKHCPGYAALPSHAEKQRFHAEMMQAQRMGAISIAWDPRAGPDGQIQRVTLSSLQTLASLLGHEPTTRKLSQAQEALAPWRTTWPASQTLLDAWHAGRSPRGVSVDALPKVIDALRVLEHCREQQYRDVSERRVSAQMFRDSKRIEALTVVLDLLTASTEDGNEMRHSEAVLAGLGLLKHPWPLLVAGPLQIQTSRADGTVDTSAVLPPYSGFSPRQVIGAAGSPAYVLTVENLTVFHELANGLAGAPRGVVLYTGGYPSPAQLRAYLTVVRSLPRMTPLWHWGDTDLGGFRIAGLLAAALADRPLRLWNMGTYDAEAPGAPLSPADLSRIDALCIRWGWDDVRTAVTHYGWRIEQELQALRLP